MLRQIRLLAAVQLKGLFGFNQVRYTKDTKEKRRFWGLGIVWIFLILLLAFYMGGTAYSMVILGMGELVPMTLFCMSSLVIFFFTAIKAGSVIFQKNSYEILISLPVTGTAIVVSRFLTMYVTNLLVSLVVMVPGLGVYGVYEKPGLSFFLFGILGTLLLPLMPITLATAAGALITAISSRMQHKSVVSAVLTILLVAAILGGSMLISGNAESFTQKMLVDMVGGFTEKLRRLNPMAVWFQNAVVRGSGIDFLLLFLVSAGAFVLMTALVSRYFLSISTALNAFSAKNDYRMRTLGVSSPLKAFWNRERRRYFASSIYVTNTMTGYCLMTLAAAGLFFTGVEKMEAFLGMPGLVSRMFPLLLAFLAAVMSTTACSISLEGKQWWILKTLPIRPKTLFDSKILWNLTLAAPFLGVAVVLGIAALRPSFWYGLWIVLIPSVYILFTAVLGITVNLKFPIFDWENETRVVKQSASTMVSMLIGVGSVIPSFLLLFLLPEAYEHQILGGTAVVLLAVTGILYRWNNQVKLIDIG